MIVCIQIIHKSREILSQFLSPYTIVPKTKRKEFGLEGRAGKAGSQRKRQKNVEAYVKKITRSKNLRAFNPKDAVKKRELKDLLKKNGIRLKHNDDRRRDGGRIIKIFSVV